MKTIEKVINAMARVAYWILLPVCFPLFLYAENRKLQAEVKALNEANLRLSKAVVSLLETITAAAEADDRLNLN